MVLEVRITVTWAEELGSEWKGHGGFWMLVKVLFPGLEGRYVGVFTLWTFTEPSAQITQLMIRSLTIKVANVLQQGC